LYCYTDLTPVSDQRRSTATMPAFTQTCQLCSNGSEWAEWRGLESGRDAQLEKLSTQPKSKLHRLVFHLVLSLEHVVAILLTKWGAFLRECLLSDLGSKR